MNFNADMVGRHMLYFVVNNQPSNVIVVDVLAQAEPGNTAVSVYPAAKQMPITVLGDAANSGRYSTSRSSSQTSNGLTTTTSDGTYQTTTSSDGTIQTTTGSH
ncbi:MAG: hypothetical protein M0Q13_07355 [Methanothrix sp.]|jgi:hypothetical protein|nr:hypothetical protein [Methanothrix sp.]